MRQRYEIRNGQSETLSRDGNISINGYTDPKNGKIHPKKKMKFALIVLLSRAE
jgi:hypothetical protein